MHCYNSLCWHCIFQVLVSLLFLNLLHVLDLVPLRPYSSSLGEKVLVPAICQCIHDVLAVWAKATSPYANLYPLAQPLLPIVTIGFSFCLKLTPPPSLHVSALISTMSGTAFFITGKRLDVI